MKTFLNKDKIKKIALLKDGDENILLLLFDNRLGLIKSNETLHLDLDKLLRNYKITTYDKDVMRFLNTLYKTDEQMEVNKRYIGNGKISETIGNNVTIFHTNKSLDYKIKDDRVEALINVNDFRQKELETTIICGNLNNFITYHNGRKLIILNNLPYEIEKVY